MGRLIINYFSCSKAGARNYLIRQLASSKKEVEYLFIIVTKKMKKKTTLAIIVASIDSAIRETNG